MATKSTNILFLDKNTDTLPTFKKAILILSPSLYWFHKESLDISLSQAKKIAPSLFEGSIPPKEYSYYVEKVGDEYWFFAYDDQEIVAKLNSLGIKPSQIAKVYPAQIALSHIQEPISVEDKVLIKENDTIIALPKTLFSSSAQPIEKIDLHLPKKYLPLKAYSSSFIPEEYIYRFAVIFFIAILIYAAQLFIYKKDLSALQAKEVALIEKYNLPPTSIQLKSILSSLKKIQTKQLALRDQLDTILRIPLQKGESLQRVEFKKKIHFEIALNNPDRAKEIKRYLINKLHITDMTVSGKTLIVECQR